MNSFSSFLVRDYFMLKRIACFSLLSAVLIAPVTADTNIIVEDFESYADDAALLAAWVSSDVTRPNNATALIPGDTAPFYGGTNLTKFAQFCGSLNDATGLANCGGEGPGGGTVNISQTAFQIAPSATQNVELTVDIGDDALSENKRLTVGLRAVTPAAQNLIELGFFNSVSTTTAPHFAYRAVLFPSGNLPGTGSWGSFSDDAIDQPLPPEIDTPSEVGAGFHRYKAVISLTGITFSLDLFADGLLNDPLDPVPGVGIAGLDAIDITAATTGPNGFNQIRFGTPSGASTPSSGGTNINAAFAAFDNISLRLVDIPVVGTPGDFDGDGDVDGRDFLAWQRGESPDPLSAADLAEWQGAYNGGALSAVSVPEPTSAGLLLLALSSLLAIKRR